jgi:hypothetical protein
VLQLRHHALSQLRRRAADVCMQAIHITAHHTKNQKGATSRQVPSHTRTQPAPRKLHFHWNSAGGGVTAGARHSGGSMVQGAHGTTTLPCPSSPRRGRLEHACRMTCRAGQPRSPLICPTYSKHTSKQKITRFKGAQPLHKVPITHAQLHNQRPSNIHSSCTGNKSSLNVVPPPPPVPHCNTQACCTTEQQSGAICTHVVPAPPC